MVKFLILFASLTIISCRKTETFKETKNYNKDDPRIKISAPIEESDLQDFLYVGMSKNDLLKVCGEPIMSNLVGDFQELEFMVSFENFEEATDWMLLTFIVRLKNDSVVSWRGNATGRLR